MDKRCVFTCGPYLGYYGRAEFDFEDGAFHGKVDATSAVATFEATSVSDLEQEFATSVDTYLVVCKEQGIEPEQPYSGTLKARVAPELHRRLAVEAKQRGVSLNQLIGDRLQGLVAADEPTSNEAARGLVAKGPRQVDVRTSGRLETPKARPAVRTNAGL